jgi:glutathione S-transferase
MKARATLCVSALNEALTDRKFLLGSSFSAVDIMTGYSMFIFNKYVSSKNHLNAYDYWQRLQHRKAYKISFQN